MVFLSILVCSVLPPREPCLPDPPIPESEQRASQFLSSGVSIAEVEDPNRPRKALGFRDLLLFYVVTGISLRWIATAAAAGPSSIVIWIGAWLVFYTPLALSVIELCRDIPAKVASTSGPSTPSATSPDSSPRGAMDLQPPLLPAALYFAASNALYMRHDSLGHLEHNPTFFIVFALVTLTIATLMNFVGLDVGTWLHNLGALAMLIPAGIVILMGAIAYSRFGSATVFNVHTLTPSMQIKDIVFWSVLVYAFAGCETASLMGDEIKNAAVPFHGRCSLRASRWPSVTSPAPSAFPRAASSQVGNLQGLMQAISSTAQKIHWEA